MGSEIGWASLGVVPTFDKFGRELEQGTSKHMLAAGSSGGTRFGDAAGKSAGKRFGSIFKTAAKASLIGIAGLGAVAFKVGKDAVGAASDLNETISKTEQIFGGKALPALEKFADGAAEAMGQSKQSALDAVATFGVMGKVAGLQGPKLGKFATGLSTLSSDLASFGNTSPEEAITAIGSALRGEAEPIRKYGILLDDATLKAEALALGILKPVKDKAKIQAYHVKVLEGQKAYNDAVGEFGPKSLEALKAEAALGSAQSGLTKATEGTIGTLTAQQKVLAAQSSIMKQSADAQGDFGRTSEGLANQQRILSARFDNVKAKLGVGLLPIVTDAAKFLNDKGVPAFEKFSDWFNEKGIPAIGNFADDAKPLVNELLPAMGDTLETVRDMLKPAAGHAKDLVGYFNDMPGWAKTAIVGGGASLLVGRKLGLGKAAGKAATSLVGSAKPIPVFVTNQGFGPDGGVAGGKAGRGKFAKVGGPLAIAGGVAFLASANEDQRKNAAAGGAAGVGGARGEDFKTAAANFDKLTASAKTYGTEVDRDKRKTEDLANLLAGPLRVKVDDSEVRSAIRAAKEYAQALRDITVASEGFEAKLQGQSYGGVSIGQVNVQADTYEDIMRKTQARARRSSSDGIPRGVTP